ncbi:hypothetical protein M436DRAFT_57094 [Aureobasidium namibiae CBS 147.97]|uniref:Apple domain-containing protein n=1 Tax=Aureobasidium namibiae CBS 147.97 TaxID=1043004 RepID=A0A074W728_9PEZI|nr:uncharacterized protein M436DRAFT_57094 [Aureobasidium namibiae CBS 147.97]KEQ68935.1 hypothetical protein M436DRAFT_57094 [Aureobasidium namibiae CBS 147.97]
MRLDTIFNWTFLLPVSTALSISSHLSTETTLQCSTLYNTSSPSTPLPTLIASVALTTELIPVILHNYTTSTVTRTPKPFETLFSVLATKTKTVEKQAVNGTLGVEVTKFRTSTFWHHVTTTRTVTKERLLTSRTTVWVETPTGFVGVRDSASASAAQDTQTPQTTPSISRRVRRERPQSSASTSSSRKAPLQKPTKERYAVSVNCERQIRIHTTETLLLTASKMATVTAKQETKYTNRTVYGTITSTILAKGSSTSAPTESSLESSSGPASGYGYSISSTESLSSSSWSLTSKRQVESTPTPILAYTPSLSPSLLDDAQTIVTNTNTVTKTPYTITFTWTATATSTLTQTLHATTTVTSHAACATGNLLGQTSNNRRINGVSLPEGLSAEIVSVESMRKVTAALCCEECISRQRCLWSVWEASGQHLGSCYLVLVNDNAPAISAGGKKQKEAGGKTTQEQKGTFGYNALNGEVRYVISNGLCGVLLES